MTNPYSTVGYRELYMDKFPDWNYIEDYRIFGLLNKKKNSFISLPGFTQYNLSTIQLFNFFKINDIYHAFMLCRTLNDNCDGFQDGVHFIANRGLIGFNDVDGINFWDNIAANSRKDSRKVLRTISSLNMMVEQVKTEEEINNFVSLYNILHTLKGISKLYALNSDATRCLLNSKSWVLLKVSEYDHILGYVIIAIHNTVVDQVFLAYDLNFRDASRKTIYMSLAFARDQLLATNYEMGGGIVEGDPLEMYKLSLGATRHDAKTVKFCSKKSPSFSMSIKLENVRWP
jgi:hypothetical protein